MPRTDPKKLGGLARLRDLGLIAVALVTLGLLALVLLRPPGAVSQERLAAGRVETARVNTEREAEMARIEAIPDVVIVGDSYTGGSDEGGVGPNGYPALLAKQFGFRISVLAVGGSGYTSRGTGAETFGERVVQAMARKPDVVVVYGSRNDSTADSDELRAAVQATLAPLATASPKPKVLIIGPAWGAFPPPGDPDAAREIVGEVASGFGFTFIDPMEQGWFTGSNSQYIGSDRIHPTDAGHIHTAGLIGAALRRMGVAPV